MKMIVKIEGYADIIDVPQTVIETRDRLKQKFYRWLYNKKNRHEYWVNESGEHDGSQFGVVFGANAFVEWLNLKILKDSEQKAVLLEEFAETWDDSLPYNYLCTDGHQQHIWNIIVRL